MSFADKLRPLRGSSLRGFRQSGRVAAKQASVIAQSGMIDFARLDRGLLALRDVRTLGVIAAPVRIGARRFADRTAVVDDREQLTYRELDRSTDRLAAALHMRGYGPHSVVATLCRDHVGTIQSIVGGAKIGARLVFLNTSMSPAQTSDVCAREGVTVLLYDTDYAEAALATQVQARYVVRGDKEGGEGDSLAGLIADGARLPAAPRPAKPGSFVLLTGGTTGLPKGAGRSVSNPLDASIMMDRIPLPLRGTTVFGAPLFHGTGLSLFLYSMGVGSTNVLRPAKFDAEELLKLAQKYRATTLVVVPTMLHRMLSVENHERYDLSSVRVIFSAGSAIPINVGNAAIARFGPVLYNLYGSSEVSVATVAMPEDWIAAPGTAGKPPIGVTVQLFDEADRPVDGPDRGGTIYVRAATMFDGYSGGGTKKMLGGFMSTGDVGHWDSDGRLFVDGRDDDMIVSGGENVFPGEVEDLLYAHPKISESAVFGVDDDEFGQRLAAVLVLEKGQDFPESEVKAYVKENLARYKVPRDIRYRAELPRTPSGKLLRRVLIEEFS